MEKSLNNVELTALHSETLNGFRLSRLMSAIARRAENLWIDGYTAKQTMNGLYVSCFQVASPEGKTYAVKVSRAAAEPGTTFGSKCSCPCFAEHKTCKHLLACEKLYTQRVQEEAAAYQD